MMKKKHFTIFMVFGILYVFIEVAYKAVLSMKGSLMGSSSLWMMLLGGMLGVVLGSINEKNSALGELPYILQVIFGALLVTAMEFLSGCILNRWLGFGIWDYSHLPFNLLGQINIVHSSYWLLMTPTAFWLDDVIRHYVYKKEKPGPFVKYYTRVIRF